MPTTKSMETISSKTTCFSFLDSSCSPERTSSCCNSHSRICRGSGSNNDTNDNDHDFDMTSDLVLSSCIEQESDDGKERDDDDDSFCSHYSVSSLDYSSEDFFLHFGGSSVDGSQKKKESIGKDQNYDMRDDEHFVELIAQGEDEQENESFVDDSDEATEDNSCHSSSTFGEGGEDHSSHSSSTFIDENGDDDDDDEHDASDDEEEREEDEVVNEQPFVSVRFADYVEIREYPVTVDDRPNCNDPCPLTLSWEYTKTVRRQEQEQSRAMVMPRRAQPAPTSSQSPSKYRKQEHKEHTNSATATGTTNICQRLTLDQRRERISITQGIELGDVYALEIQVLMNRVQDLMRMKTTTVTTPPPTLPPPSPPRRSRAMAKTIMASPTVHRSSLQHIPAARKRSVLAPLA